MERSELLNAERLRAKSLALQNRRIDTFTCDCTPSPHFSSGRTNLQYVTRNKMITDVVHFGQYRSSVKCLAYKALPGVAHFLSFNNFSSHARNFTSPFLASPSLTSSRVSNLDLVMRVEAVTNLFLSILRGTSNRRVCIAYISPQLKRL